MATRVKTLEVHAPARRITSIGGKNPLLQVAVAYGIGDTTEARTMGAKPAVVSGPAATRGGGESKRPRASKTSVNYRQDIPYRLARHTTSGLLGLATNTSGGRIIIETCGVLKTFPAEEVAFVTLPPTPKTAFCSRDNEAETAGRQAAQEEKRLINPVSEILAIRWPCHLSDSEHGPVHEVVERYLPKDATCTILGNLEMEEVWVRRKLQDKPSELVDLLGTYAVPEEFFLCAHKGQSVTILRVETPNKVRKVMAAVHAGGFVAVPAQTEASQAKTRLQRTQIYTLRPVCHENMTPTLRKNLADPCLRSMAEKALKVVLALVDKTPDQVLDSVEVLEEAARLLQVNVMLTPTTAMNSTVNTWSAAAVPVALALLSLCKNNTMRAITTARNVFIDVMANYVEAAILVLDFDASEDMVEDHLKTAVQASMGFNGVTISKTRNLQRDLAQRAFYHAYWGMTCPRLQQECETVLKCLAMYGVGVRLINIYTQSDGVEKGPGQRTMKTKWVTVAPWKEIALGGVAPPLVDPPDYL